MAVRRSPEETDRLRKNLLRHARTLVHRNGAEALTMRTLAREAGCAVGLPYKVFADREEIVTELIGMELDEFSADLTDWLEQSEAHTVAENLDRYSSIVLNSRLTALFHASGGVRVPLAKTEGLTEQTSTVVASLDSIAVEYLRREQQRGRVRGEIDADALGFLIAGAVHNLLWAGDAYRRPTRPELTDLLEKVATALAPAH